MQMHRKETVRTATKIRLYPTTEQQQKLAGQFGCARFVWNRVLSLNNTFAKMR